MKVSSNLLGVGVIAKSSKEPMAKKSVVQVFLKEVKQKPQVTLVLGAGKVCVVPICTLNWWFRPFESGTASVSAHLARNTWLSTWLVLLCYSAVASLCSLIMEYYGNMERLA